MTAEDLRTGEEAHDEIFVNHGGASRASTAKMAMSISTKTIRKN